MLGLQPRGLSLPELEQIGSTVPKEYVPRRRATIPPDGPSSTSSQMSGMSLTSRQTDSLMPTIVHPGLAIGHAAREGNEAQAMISEDLVVQELERCCEENGEDLIGD